LYGSFKDKGRYSGEYLERAVKLACTSFKDIPVLVSILKIASMQFQPFSIHRHSGVVRSSAFPESTA
jgi:hypothetical protein